MSSNLKGRRMQMYQRICQGANRWYSDVKKRTTGSSVCKNVLRLGPDRCRDVKIIGTRHDFAKSEVRSYEAIQGKTIVLYSLMSSKYFSVYRQHCSDRHHSSALRHFVCYACLLLCHPVQCFRL